MLTSRAFVGLAGLFLVASTQPGGAPSALLPAANGSPVALVMLLAHAHVPAGLEVHASDQAPQAKPVFQFEREPVVPLTTLARAFNAHHDVYQAAIMNGVFVVRPTAGRVSFLDTDSTLRHVEVMGVMNAAQNVFGDLDPRLRYGQAVAGSYLNYDPADAGEQAVISLDGRGRTYIELLNDIVRQSPRGWIVVTSDDAGAPRILKFGFMNRKGSAIYQPVSDKTK